MRQGRRLRLSVTGRKWLKVLHLAAAACWIGGAVSLLSLWFLKQGLLDGAVVHGINRAAHQVDMAVVVVPGAFGCLFTGLAYSLLTDWGFLRHGWIIAKWVLTVGAVLFGTFYLGPWETAMMELTGELGSEALTDAQYIRSQELNFQWGTVQVGVLLLTVWLSVFKPFRNLQNRKDKRHA